MIKLGKALFGNALKITKLIFCVMAQKLWGQFPMSFTENLSRGHFGINF